MNNLLWHKGQAEAAWQEKRYADALTNAEACIEIRPSAGAHLLCGTACQALGRLDAAEAHFQTVIRRAPDCGQAHLNLAHLHLLRGDYANGWKRLYDVRERFPELYPVRFSSKLPLWTGEQDLGDRLLQLVPWEGAGDAIQFLRYAAVVKEQHPGVRVGLFCPPHLKRLAQSCKALDYVWTAGEPVPTWDYWANLLNMAHLCGTASVEAIPAAVPYVSADPALVDSWRKRLPLPAGKRRVAICWQGSPTHAQDAQRSVTPEHFLPLTGPGVQLFSVQKDATNNPAGVIQVDGLTDFADTAAVLSLMDLVVTVDTSIAHLAGDMGLPVWIALPLVPDWRWLMGRTDSPWYPTARLFRQRQAGEWGPVFAEMADLLSSENRKAA